MSMELISSLLIRQTKGFLRNITTHPINTIRATRLAWRNGEGRTTAEFLYDANLLSRSLSSGLPEMVAMGPRFESGQQITKEILWQAIQDIKNFRPLFDLEFKVDELEIKIKDPNPNNFLIEISNIPMKEGGRARLDKRPEAKGEISVKITEDGILFYFDSYSEYRTRELRQPSQPVCPSEDKLDISWEDTYSSPPAAQSDADCILHDTFEWKQYTNYYKVENFNLHHIVRQLLIKMQDIGAFR